MCCRVITLICHKVTSDGWTSYRMKGVGGSTSLGAMTSTFSVLRWPGKLGILFARRLGKKKKRGQTTFQRGIEFSLFKRVSIHDRFLSHTENNIFSQRVLELIFWAFLCAGHNTLINCLCVLKYLLFLSVFSHSAFTLCIPNILVFSRQTGRHGDGGYWPVDTNLIDRSTLNGKSIN